MLWRLPKTGKARIAILALCFLLKLINFIKLSEQDEAPMKRVDCEECLLRLQVNLRHELVLGSAVLDGGHVHGGPGVDRPLLRLLHRRPRRPVQAPRVLHHLQHDPLRRHVRRLRLASRPGVPAQLGPPPGKFTGFSFGPSFSPPPLPRNPGVYRVFGFQNEFFEIQVPMNRIFE